MANPKFDLAGYVTVPERIAEFRALYPQGSLQPVNPERPYWCETLDGQTWIVYCAAAYRTPDDPRPGIGTAWEPYPGRTPYTRGSEVQNAETSAWGRAIMAALACTPGGSVATAEEVASAREREAGRTTTTPSRRPRQAGGSPLPPSGVEPPAEPPCGQSTLDLLKARAIALDAAGVDVKGERSRAGLPGLNAELGQADAANWSDLLDVLEAQLAPFTASAVAEADR